MALCAKVYYMVVRMSPASHRMRGRQANGRLEHNKRRRPTVYRRNKPEVVDPYCSDSPMHLSLLFTLALVSVLSTFFLVHHRQIDSMAREIQVLSHEWIQQRI